MPLSKGDIAPDFQLQDQNNQPVSLDGLLVDGPLALFFYPKDHTAGCTRQACSFRDNRSLLTEKGIAVAGISRDSSADHASFDSSHTLSYPLLADRDGTVHRQYKVLSLFGLLPRRITYLINPDRSIAWVHEDNFRMESHVEAVLQASDMIGRK